MFSVKATGQYINYSQREGEGGNSNSKTLIIKDSSVRSIWTCLTASPCYSTNTNKHGYTTNRYYERDRQTDRDRETDRMKDRQRQRQREIESIFLHMRQKGTKQALKLSTIKL